MPRVLAVLFPLALLLALAACSGSEPAPSPTPTGPAGTPVAKPAAKIVTEIQQAPTSTPVPPTPTPQPPTPTPLPVARLELLSHRTYKDATGALWVVGEAENTGDTAATDVEVTLTLAGADGKLLATTWATTHLAEVLPGARMPLRGVFPQPPDNWKDVKISLAATPVYPNTRTAFVSGLKAEQTTLTTPVAGGGPVIAGLVRNAGPLGATSIRVMAVLRGSDGKVLDVVDGYARLAEVAPGATSPFSLQFDNAKQTGPYEVFVQGRQPPK